MNHYHTYTLMSIVMSSLTLHGSDLQASNGRCSPSSVFIKLFLCLSYIKSNSFTSLHTLQITIAHDIQAQDSRLANSRLDSTFCPNSSCALVIQTWHRPQYKHHFSLLHHSDCAQNNVPLLCRTAIT
jgi:hypothetical protein